MAVVFFWWKRGRPIRDAIRGATRSAMVLEGATLLISPALLEPGVFGILRPVLLLPAGIDDRLTAQQMKAVLAHELCHVERRDNLAAALHMVVEAIFWFHPLVWWIGARLVEERERACDEAVLRAGNTPKDYAEGILNVCKFYLESPLECVSGVTGSNLKHRIERIMTPRETRALNLARKLLLAVAGIGAVAVPIAIGVIDAPSIRAQATPVQGQRPAFEVASIKLSKEEPPFRLGVEFKNGTMHAENVTLRWMIEIAYQLPFGKDYVVGGPEWLDKQRYYINAKSPNVSPDAAAKRMMLQSLLADRFQLSMSRETKEMPIYALVVNKGGPKLDRAVDRDCSEPRSCHHFSGGRTGFAGNMVNMSDLAEELSVFLDRAVQDHTGITGNFDMKIPGWTDPVRPPSPGVIAGVDAPPDPNAPDIFAVLQREFGLKLESRKATVQTYVVDRVAKPTEN